MNHKKIKISSRFEDAGSTPATMPYTCFKPLEDKVQAWLDERVGTLAEDLTETDFIMDFHANKQPLKIPKPQARSKGYPVHPGEVQF